MACGSASSNVNEIEDKFGVRIQLTELSEREGSSATSLISLSAAAFERLRLKRRKKGIVSRRREESSLERVSRRLEEDEEARR